MLGFYVHTHWAYNRPYAARTWTVSDWEGYLGGLKALGYDTVMVWPQHEIMPSPLTASDVAFLEKLAQVIDLAHEKFGLQVIITTAPNVSSRPNSAE